jgi:sucrose-6-phosphatase
MDDDPDASRWLLISDIDDTLTGDRDALQRLWESVSGARSTLLFALNSSRPAASVDETIASYFPDGFRPDAIVTGLGTQIRVDGEWLTSWSDRFLQWPRAEIVAIVEAMGFVPHDAAFQTPAKASFAVEGQSAVDKVLQALERNNLPFQALYSGKSDLDILAPGAGKDAATRFLADFFEISPSNVVAAGDSGNDLAMFNAAGRAIAVGNARAELVNAMPRDKSYLAASRHAAGVYEGLVELGILPNANS